MDRKRLYTFRENNFLVFLIRFASLYLLWGICRLIFCIHNGALIGPVEPEDIRSVLHGSFIFDTVSILYLNIPFIVLSLIPLRIREKRWWGVMLAWLFVVVNALGLAINIADIYYYPYKLAPISFDDVHYAGESNFPALIFSFLIDFWQGALWFALCVAALALVAVKVRYRPWKYRDFSTVRFYAGQGLLFVLAILWSAYGVRGFVAFRGTFPVAMSDATLYVRPQYSPLVLSNPFCLIRTWNQRLEVPEYMSAERAGELAPVEHLPLDSAAVRLDGRPNIVFLILESFGSAHIGALNDEIAESYTPNLDSILNESYLFTNAYHNGSRSLDALPSIWASIPSFRTQFLAMSESLGEFYPVTAMLRDMGYTTIFAHGAVREAMSFAAFGRSAGVEVFYSREDYEREHGKGDYDGHWGIFDHKFLPFVLGKLDAAEAPFCATLFTLSSHHPYLVPEPWNGRIPQMEMPIQRAIAYSDDVIGEFFRRASQAEWFSNTLFVITADHGSENPFPHWQQPPFNYAVPIALHYPAAGLKGRDPAVMQHINIAPTLARMIGGWRRLFGFGLDIFNEADRPFAIYYNSGAFNYLSGDTLYRFDGRELVDARRWREGPAEEVPDMPDEDGWDALGHLKAFIQNYYYRLSLRDYR